MRAGPSVHGRVSWITNATDPHHEPSMAAYPPEVTEGASLLSRLGIHSSTGNKSYSSMSTSGIDVLRHERRTWNAFPTVVSAV